MKYSYEVNVPQKNTVTEVDVLKEKVVTAARILEREGCYDYIGHVSALVPESVQWLITPHLRELSFRDITPRDIVTMNLNYEQVEGHFKHPSEFWIHGCIYNARSDVKAVVHVHPEACVIAGIAEVQLAPLYVTSGIFSKGVPIFREPALIFNRELGEALAKTLGECNAALLKWHGVVVVGPSIEEAVMATIALEKLARLYIGASLVASSRGFEAVPPGSQLIDPVLLSPYAGWEYYLSRLKST